MALDKKRLRREIERERRARLKARLAELRELIKKARAERRQAIAFIRQDCREKRIAHRLACQARAAEARSRGATQIEARRGELAQELADEQVIRDADRRHFKVRSTARERRQESDDEVRSNLPPELVPVFERFGRSLKGGPRRTRTEAFLEWVEENPDVIYEFQQQDADRWLGQLLAEQAQLQKAQRRGRGARVSLGGVPF